MANQFIPVGVTGLTQYSGYIYEEKLRELQGDKWRAVLAQMVNHPLLGGILFAIQMLIRQTDWTVTPGGDTPADKDIAEFVQSCLHDMREPWALTLSEMLSFLPWGWALMEITPKVRQGEVKTKLGERDALRSSAYDDGKIGWASWGIRAQDTLLHWEFDDEGTPIAMIQLAPPDFKERRIPLAKCLHLLTAARKGNPEGVSMFRTAYEPWYYEKNIKRIEGIGIERDLAGLPIVFVPPELLDPNAPAEVRAVLEYYKSIVVNVRRDEQEGILLPSAFDANGKPLYDFRLLSTGGTRQFDTEKVIQRYLAQMAMSILADFILLGHQQVGSFALASSKTSLFSTALGAWLDTICGVVNSDAIPQLLKLNGIKVEKQPLLTHGDVETLDLTSLGTFFATLSNAGELFKGPGGELLYQYLLKQAGVPQPVIDASKGPDEKPPGAQPGEKQQPTPRPADTEAPPAGPATASEQDAIDELISSVFDAALAEAEAV